MLNETLDSTTVRLLDPKAALALELIYHEARLLDEKRYEEWDKLWADGDTRYVIPLDRDVVDFDSVLNLVNDNAVMRRRRIARMTSGYAGAVNAVERTVRVVSRYEFQARDEDELEVRSAEIVVAYVHGEHQVWAADLVHHIDLAGAEPRIRHKVVHLIDAEHTVRTCGFLL
ncbi:aromatic-ring-hydroxylating dioxygenase subunit beta [Pseudonocardia hispaniensis]|uniref:Aromatic-ring-hydroxylating dioxygenase subunit beta n=1 Tax=Pseudonocardia hispaniensis TaxID=904933 RepID=A0ABW1IWZ5_9PSEU